MDKRIEEEFRKRILNRTLLLNDGSESTKQAFIQEVLKVIPNAEIIIDSKNRVKVGIKK